jgi:hypothetical protein
MNAQNRVGRRAAVWTVFAALTLLLFAAGPAGAEPAQVRVASGDAGSTLQVDGKDFMVFGMNWDYTPIGENYLYDLWSQPDPFIQDVLGREMPLLQAMGVNAIRQYAGIPPRWVQYIYEHYGIYTLINHPMARYGYTLDGVWMPSVNYSDPRLRAALKDDVTNLVKEFRDVPGVLMWLLGNENNYGLSWTSFEIQALPEGERDAARAKYLYSLFDEVAVLIKDQDSHPVAISNGDVQYIDVIARECPHIDVFGTNVYRGISARDLFQVVKDKLGIPVLFTEFGSDAFNAREMREDQLMQARYLLGQWQEIYEQSAGKGGVGNAIGGFVFQWSDGWWKFGQESRLDIHDTNASWPNGGYPEDYVEGENNMNEEWWGICAKGRPDYRGAYTLYPRAAYYALREAFQLDPYAPGTTRQAIRDHFLAVNPAWCELQARSNAPGTETVRLTGARLEFETYSTGGSRISTPKASSPQQGFPAYRGFDHMESFYLDSEVAPAPNVVGTLSLNILGHVPINPIDEIFYENRGRTKTVALANGDSTALEGIERVKVFGATVSWDDPRFRLNGFYRTGHLHWGYEGDLFGLYRDAYYGENINVYNAQAPLGVEIEGKRNLEGLKIAFGPELYWGANPSYFVKYQRKLGSLTATGIYQDEFSDQASVSSSIAVPEPPTRRATLGLSGAKGRLGFVVGGIWSGSTKKGETFQIAEKTSTGYNIFVDKVKAADTFGAKAKLTYEEGRWHWYAQGSYTGIVADGGPDATTTFTGWTLKDAGAGNTTNFLTGLAMNAGEFQIAPNVLWQKPIEGPIPGDVLSPGRPRNVLDDPFAVRASRETVGAELIVSHDPTPATWMWAWDNDRREDARLAWSLGLVYRDYKTTQDASIGILGDGRTTFAFPGATPPRKLWEANLRLVSRLGGRSRLVAHVFGGTGEPTGDDPRLIHRYGADARLTVGSAAFETFAKVNDWGLYDYHRDFNLTYPVQLMGDISHTLGTPVWFGLPQTRIGIRGTWRSLDRYSPRYCPGRDPSTSECDPLAPGDTGTEWEVRTYLHIVI